MYSCWDCKRFGIHCDGIILPDEQKGSVEIYCKRFLLNEWRGIISKKGGEKML